MNENCVQAPFRVTGAGWQMEQCPYAGGKAVYQARAILSMVNDTIEYFDDAVCLQSGISRQQKDEKISKVILPEITIIPIPAKDYIEVRIHGNAEGLCYISILNLLGENTIVEQMSCDEKGKRINISNLVQGVYTVRVLNNKLIKTVKLVINR